MVTILYPERDYEAADIAIKAQALSNNKENVLYIIPKHYGRNRNSIYSNLDKTKVCLFLMYETTKIDDETIEELNYLSKRKVKMYFILPERKKIDFSFFGNRAYEEIRYNPANKEKVLEEINKFTENHSTVNENKSVSDTTSAIVIIILVLSVIALAFSGSKSKK